jgi:hypothetical protein
MGTAPLPNPPDCGNYSEPTGHNVAPAPPSTATATPVLESPCGFTHLTPLQAPVTYKIVHPVSVRTVPGGTAEADFGQAFVGVPVVRFPGSSSAQRGNQVTMTASYRLAAPFTRSHADGVWVQGSRAGTDTLDIQATNLDFYCTQDGTPARDHRGCTVTSPRF